MGMQSQHSKPPGFDVDSELVIKANEFAQKIEDNVALSDEDKQILPSALACLPDQSLIDMLSWDNDRYGLFGVPGETAFGGSGPRGLADRCAYVCKDLDSSHLILYNEMSALIFASGSSKWELVGMVKTHECDTAMSTLIASPGIKDTLEEAFQFRLDDTQESDGEHVSDYWRQYDGANSSDGELEQDVWPQPEQSDSNSGIRDSVLQDHLICTLQTSLNLISDLTKMDPLAIVLTIQQFLPLEVRPSLPISQSSAATESLQPHLQLFLDKSLRAQLKLMSLSGCDYSVIKKMLEVALIHCIP